LSSNKKNKKKEIKKTRIILKNGILMK